MCRGANFLEGGKDPVILPDSEVGLSRSDHVLKQLSLLALFYILYLSVHTMHFVIVADCFVLYFIKK